jgi:hypothetical protein
MECQAKPENVSGKALALAQGGLDPEFGVWKKPLTVNDESFLQSFRISRDK